MSTMNPLAPASVVKEMADALPTHEKDDNTSDCSSSIDAIALFAHACMVLLGFRLLGFNEDQKIEAECSRLAPRLPSEWNSNLNSHGFVYAHSQSSMQFVVKVDRLGGKIEIRGLAVGDERIARFDITARDYVSSAALPLRISKTADGLEDRSNLQQKLQKVFITDERITDLANLLKINIIQRLLPSLQKEGYQETLDDRQAREDADRAGRSSPQRPLAPQLPAFPQPAPPHPYPFVDPLAGSPRPPVRTGDDIPLPGWGDPHEINSPPRGPLPPPSGRPFGYDDLYPQGLGPHDPIRGSFVGSGGLPRPGGMGMEGGMHPTFDDPLFQGPHGGGGDARFDLQVPSGARYDPVVPGGAPRFGGGRPGGRGGRFGGGGEGWGTGDII